jgi:hypothetical protein
LSALRTADGGIDRSNRDLVRRAAGRRGGSEQVYDDDVSEALRRLAEDGFPLPSASREMTVPVFSLEGRIVRRAPTTGDEDVYVD